MLHLHIRPAALASQHLYELVMPCTSAPWTLDCMQLTAQLCKGHDQQDMISRT